MAIPYDRLKATRGLSVKPLRELSDRWRKLAPVRGLILIISFHLIFSSAWIIAFSQSFNFGKRMIVLHFSIISCLIAVTTLCLGSLLLIRRIREWRFTRYFFVLVLGTGFSALVLLYLVDYVGNRLWGSNINYELAAHYIFDGGIFQKQMVPARVYLLVAIGLTIIFSAYLSLSGLLLRNLEQLFLPGRGCSLFRDKRRGLVSVAGIFLFLSLMSGIGFQSARVESPYRDRLLSHEPILSLLTNSDSLNDLISYTKRTRLEAEEESARATYPAGQPFEKKNVVIIMVDSLRADHMQVYGYERPTTPFLDSLFKTGQLKKVEMALSNCADTNCGVMATLASRLLGRQIPNAFKLPDVLQAQGYDLHYILAGSHRWYNLQSAYGTNPTYYFDGTDSPTYDWNDDRVLLEGLEKVPHYIGPPAFLYFHLMSTHSTGTKQEAYRVYQPAQNWIEFRSGEFDSASITNYYDNGVIQADAMIRGIFDGLKRKGYLENSLVVILADHGEGLGQPDHSLYGHVNYLYQESIRIPLLIYDSDSGARYANLEHATQIDVAPTILNRLGLAIPSSWEGQSLAAPDSKSYSFHQAKIYPPSYAVIYRKDGATYKYLKQAGFEEELYELVSDPRERHNLMGSADREIVERMRGELVKMLSDDR